jgi:hypothetical protein
VRLICTEGRFSELMAQLALHRMDLVIADEPLSNRLSVKAFNHALGSSHMSFFAAPALAATAEGAVSRVPERRADADPGRQLHHPAAVRSLAAAAAAAARAWSASSTTAH